MTGAQRAALRLLADHSRSTGKSNGYGAIGGRTAACLERMGYAQREFNVEDRVTVVHITEEGRRALGKA